MSAPGRPRRSGPQWCRARLGSRSPEPYWRRCALPPLTGQLAPQLNEVAIAIVPVVEDRKIADDLVNNSHYVSLYEFTAAAAAMLVGEQTDAALVAVEGLEALRPSAQ